MSWGDHSDDERSRRLRSPRELKELGDRLERELAEEMARLVQKSEGLAAALTQGGSALSGFVKPLERAREQIAQVFGVPVQGVAGATGTFLVKLHNHPQPVPDVTIGVGLGPNWLGVAGLTASAQQYRIGPGATFTATWTRQPNGSWLTEVDVDPADLVPVQRPASPTATFERYIAPSEAVPLPLSFWQLDPPHEQNGYTYDRVHIGISQIPSSGGGGTKQATIWGLTQDGMHANELRNFRHVSDPGEALRRLGYLPDYGPARLALERDSRLLDEVLDGILGEDEG